MSYVGFGATGDILQQACESSGCRWNASSKSCDCITPKKEACLAKPGYQWNDQEQNCVAVLKDWYSPPSPPPAPSNNTATAFRKTNCLVTLGKWNDATGTCACPAGTAADANGVCQKSTSAADWLKDIFGAGKATPSKWEYAKQAPPTPPPSPPSPQPYVTPPSPPPVSPPTGGSSDASMFGGIKKEYVYIGLGSVALLGVGLYFAKRKAA